MRLGLGLLLAGGAGSMADREELSVRNEWCGNALLVLSETGTTASAQAQTGEFTLKIVDEETRRPLPCRVSVRTEKGVAKRAEEMPFWYDHFVMPGEVRLSWGLGTYPMRIERGLEYLPRMGHFQLNKFADDSKTETLRRFIDLSKKGWWSGDLMVVRELEEIELLMLADDLHFVPLAESAEKRIFSANQKKEAERRAEARKRAGRNDPVSASQSKKDAPNAAGKARSGKSGNAKSDEVWFDSDRLFTTQNYVLRHPSCCVGILNLPTKIQFKKLNLEARRSPIPLLYAIHQKYPDAWFDVQDADCWDLPLLVALGAVDSFQVLGPHILRDQLLPENVCWRRLPTLKTLTKINVQKTLKEEKPSKRPDPEANESLSGAGSDEKSGSESDPEILAEIRQDLFVRPSQCEFIPDAMAMNYRDARGRQQWTEEVYFHLLNTGHRLPPTAGSGSGMSPNAVGSNRTYVFVDPEEYSEKADRSGYQFEGANAGFNRKMWWNALREGHAVITNGPLLQPWVEGCVPGEVFTFPEGDEPEKLNPSMTLTMQQKAQYVEILMNGRVIQSIPFRNYAETGRLPLLEVKESGWFLIRVVADEPQTYCCVMSAPYYVEMGQKTAIQEKSAQFFVNWEKKRIRMLEKRGIFEDSEGQKLRELHDYALTYWERLLKMSQNP